ncbi:MAG: hypothetical protein H3C31_13520 [Brumimicrobium sp.]|nr:hypothetical protein [Brumimicrobium sp.]
MRKKILLLVFSFLVVLVHAQESNNYPKYFLLIEDANQLIKSKNYKTALEKYLEAFRYANYIPEKDLKQAKVLAKKMDIDSLTVKFKTQLSNLYKNIDTDYQRDINIIYKKDQEVRTNKYMKALAYYRLCNSDSNYVRNEKKYTRAQLKSQIWRDIDSTNIHTLLKMMDNNGFPSEEKVGVSCANKAFIILLHYDYDKENVILKPYLDNALSNGHITPRNYAQIIDRRKINNGEKPVYYVIPLGYFDLSVEQKKIVDELRFKIGLLPINKSQKIVKKKHSIRVIYND